jgi:hypothetical protein
MSARRVSCDLQHLWTTVFWPHEPLDEKWIVYKIQYARMSSAFLAHGPILNVLVPSDSIDVVDGAVVAEAATNSSVARERDESGINTRDRSVRVVISFLKNRPCPRGSPSRRVVGHREPLHAPAFQRGQEQSQSTHRRLCCCRR